MKTLPSIKQLDQQFMAAAIHWAEKGRPSAYPNPLVGALLVRKKAVLAAGYHACFGGPHAEVAALTKAGKGARGATLYVTLEPCSQYGKTGPCTRAILRSGIRRVVVGALDPNRVNRGRGIRELRTAGLQVEHGILDREVLRQNEVFCRWISEKRPFVTLKMAESLDGKIATVSGQSRWITGERSRRFVRELRRGHQAVLVGKNTVLLDDPRLNSGANGQQPIRVVLDKNLEIPLSRRIFHAPDKKVIVVASEKSYKNKFAFYERLGIGLLAVPLRSGGLDLAELLKRLGEMGISSLLVEGGGETAARFFEEGLVDKVYFFLAPKIFGGANARTSVEGAGIRNLRDAIDIGNTKVLRLGRDLLVVGYPQYRNEK